MTQNTAVSPLQINVELHLDGARGISSNLLSMESLNQQLVSINLNFHGTTSSEKAPQRRLPTTNLDSLPPELHRQIAEAIFITELPVMTDQQPLLDALHFSLVNKHYKEVAKPVLDKWLQIILAENVTPAPWSTEFTQERQRWLQMPITYDTPHIISELAEVQYDSLTQAPIPNSLAQIDMELFKIYFQNTSPYFCFIEYVSSLCQLPRRFRAWAVRKTFNVAHFDLQEENIPLQLHDSKWAWYSTVPVREFLDPWRVIKPGTGLRVVDHSYCVGWISNCIFEIFLEDIARLEEEILACLLKSMNYNLLDLELRRDQPFGRRIRISNKLLS